METNEIKENKKLIILIGILFAIIIGLLIVLIFITNNSKKSPESDSSTTTTTTNTQIVEKNPYDLSKLNNEEIRFIDVEELNKYEYTMENNLFTKINNESTAYNSFVNNYTADFMFSYVPFLKISNKKLYWKVNNEWKEDNKITEEIKFVTYFSSDVTINEFIIITPNKIYIIEIPNGIDTISDILEKQSLNEFNNKYNNLKYHVINERVTNIMEKGQVAECHIINVIYLLINDKVYVLNSVTSAPVLASDYYKDFSSIVYNYIQSCGFMQPSITLNQDGIIQNDNIDKTIIKTVKYYFGNEKFEMIVDKNMNYYLKSNNKDYYGILKKINFNKKTQEIEITTNNEKNIILTDTSNGLYN